MNPPRRLDLRLLTSLEALIEARSVSRAADRIGVSQPAMSRTLARLRDQIGDPILVRGRGGMVLTPRAEALAEPLKGWLDRGEAILRPPAFEPADIARTFRIASTDFGILSVVRPAAAAIAAQAPGVSLEIEAISSDSLRRLAEGRLDLVIIGYLPEMTGVGFSHLFTETRLGLMRRDHPAAYAPMDQAAFLRWPHVTALVGAGLEDPLHDGLQDPQFQDAEIMRRRRVLMAAASFASVPFMVAETDALAVLPSRASRHFAEVYGLATFEPPVRLPTFDYYVAWHDRTHTDEPTRWLAGQFEEGCRAHRPHGRRTSGAKRLKLVS